MFASSGDKIHRFSHDEPHKVTPFIQKYEENEKYMNCVVTKSAPKFRVSTFNRACDVLNLLNVR